MALRRHDAVIVGAGIAGLAAAWELRDRDVLVLEATERVGGRMRSEPRGPYWLNLGAHLFGGPGSLLDRLITEVGLETRPILGNRMGLSFGDRLLAGGRPETYPFRLPLSLAARWSFIRTGLRLRRAAQGYLREARPRPGETPAQTRARVLAYGDRETFADYLGAMHPDVEAIFQAVAERVTGSLSEISAGCGATLFALLWGDDKALARNLIGGSELLPQALAQRLGSRVVTGAPVREVVPVDGGMRVRFVRDGQASEVEAAYLVAATPAFVTGQVVRGLPAETTAALARIPYGPFVVAAILTEEVGPVPWDDVYAIAAARRSFNMLFNHANVVRVPGKREPGGSLMVYAGAERGRRLLALTDEQVRDTFLPDVHAVLPGTRGLVREVLIQRWEHAIPYVAPGRGRLQAALDRPLGRVFLAGDYLEFPEMEAAAQTGREAALEIRRRLTSS